MLLLKLCRALLLKLNDEVKTRGRKFSIIPDGLASFFLSHVSLVFHLRYESFLLFFGV
jgi:hypothetical protein